MSEYSSSLYAVCCVPTDQIKTFSVIRWVSETALWLVRLSEVRWQIIPVLMSSYTECSVAEVGWVSEILGIKMVTACLQLILMYHFRHRITFTFHLASTELANRAFRCSAPSLQRFINLFIIIIIIIIINLCCCLLILYFIIVHTICAVSAVYASRSTVAMLVTILVLL